jgi:hypothetical protein
MLSEADFLFMHSTFKYGRDEVAYSMKDRVNTGEEVEVGIRQPSLQSNQ